MPSSGSPPNQTFASLLDARARFASGAGSAAAPGSRPSPAAQAMGAILDSAPGPGAQPPADAADALARSYEPVAEAATPSRSCEPAALVRELQLHSALTSKDLERIRRDFARANHPDSVAPADRDLATRRMALANVLIDQALQARRRPSR